MKFFRIYFFTLLLLFAHQCDSYAQKIKKVDKNDLYKFNQMLQQARDAMDTSTANAIILINQLKSISRRIGIDSLMAKTYIEEGYCNFNEGKYKNAANAFDSAGILWQNADSLNYAKALNNKANALMYASEYYYSMVTFLNALAIFQKLNNKKGEAGVLMNIGLIYESLMDWDNALIFDKRGLNIKLKINDSSGIARSYGNIGNIYMYKEMPDSAIYFQRLSYNINEALNNKSGVSNALGNIGNAYRKKGMFDSAIVYLQQAIKISEKLGNAENNANFLNNIGESYFIKGDVSNAMYYATLASKYVGKISDLEFLQQHYNLMYRIQKHIGNNEKAFVFLEKLDAVNDSIFRQKINIQNQKSVMEYEYRQKSITDSLLYQAQINASEKKATATKNRLIITTLLLLLTAALASVWYVRGKLLKKKNIVAQQNTILHEQKIRELENEKQLMASKALLLGQEEERSRMAKDLHDGLGGLLTGVKHSIINMKEKIILSGDSVSAFEKSLGMIDTSMKELRRIAHNMMPEALAKFGLREAINDYCASVSTKETKVVFQCYGEDVNLDSTSEVIIYRIIQELVNNALKHSAATEVSVQVVKGDTWTTLSVEDNGCGMDRENLKSATGAGWANVQSRVNYLNGNLDIHSEPGKGTSVNIELNTSKA